MYEDLQLIRFESSQHQPPDMWENKPSVDCSPFLRAFYLVPSRVKMNYFPRSLPAETTDLWAISKGLLLEATNFEMLYFTVILTKTMSAMKVSIFFTFLYCSVFPLQLIPSMSPYLLGPNFCLPQFFSFSHAFHLVSQNIASSWPL